MKRGIWVACICLGLGVGAGLLIFNFVDRDAQMAISSTASTATESFESSVGSSQSPSIDEKGQNETPSPEEALFKTWQEQFYEIDLEELRNPPSHSKAGYIEQYKHENGNWGLRIGYGSNSRYWVWDAETGIASSYNGSAIKSGIFESIVSIEVYSGFYWTKNRSSYSYPDGNPDPAGILAEFFGLQEYRYDDTTPDWLNLMISEMRQSMYIPFVEEDDPRQLETNRFQPLVYYSQHAEGATPVFFIQPEATFFFIGLGDKILVESNHMEVGFRFFTDNEKSLIIRANYMGPTYYQVKDGSIETLFSMYHDDVNEPPSTLITVGETSWKENMAYEEIQPRAEELLAEQGIGPLTELERVELTIPEGGTLQNFEDAIVNAMREAGYI